MYRITDQGLNLTYGNVATRTSAAPAAPGALRVSYVTGIAPVQDRRQRSATRPSATSTSSGTIPTCTAPAVNYRFSNGVPNQLTLLDAPWNFQETTRDIALFAQDQWTINRLTLNLGARYNDAHR